MCVPKSISNPARLVLVPEIICPQCGTENRPAGISSLVCDRCGRSIDPRGLQSTPEQFVRRQQKLRKKAKLAPLEAEDADELLAWLLELPPESFPPADDIGGAVDGGGRGPSPLAAVRRWRAGLPGRRRPDVLYSDRIVRMRDDAVVINRYYWPFGRKRIPYTRIRDFTARPLKAWHGQFRVHGIDHLGRWYSRDRHRGEKELAIDLTIGWLIRPVLTPEDVDTVLEILETQVPVHQP